MFKSFARKIKVAKFELGQTYVGRIEETNELVDVVVQEFPRAYIRLLVDDVYSLNLYKKYVLTKEETSERLYFYISSKNKGGDSKVIHVECFADNRLADDSQGKTVRNRAKFEVGQTYVGRVDETEEFVKVKITDMDSVTIGLKVDNKFKVHTNKAYILSLDGNSERLYFYLSYNNENWQGGYLKFHVECFADNRLAEIKPKRKKKVKNSFEVGNTYYGRYEDSGVLVQLDYLEDKDRNTMSMYAHNSQWGITVDKRLSMTVEGDTEVIRFANRTEYSSGLRRYVPKWIVCYADNRLKEQTKTNTDTKTFEVGKYYLVKSQQYDMILRVSKRSARYVTFDYVVHPNKYVRINKDMINNFTRKDEYGNTEYRFDSLSFGVSDGNDTIPLKVPIINDMDSHEEYVSYYTEDKKKPSYYIRTNASDVIDMDNIIEPDLPQHVFQVGGEYVSVYSHEYIVVYHFEHSAKFNKKLVYKCIGYDGDTATFVNPSGEVVTYEINTVDGRNDYFNVESTQYCITKDIDETTGDRNGEIHLFAQYRV